MNHIQIIKEAGSYLTSLGAWLLKQGFSKEKLAKKVIVGLAAHHSAICINCSDNPNIRVLLNVRNYSPFAQKIDNLTTTFYQGGVSVKLRLDRKQTISAFNEENVYLEENITADQSRQLALADSQTNSPRLDYHADFVCKLHEFEKSGSINSLPLEKRNAHMHKVKAVS